jgi:mannose-6-phosphate isomerase-like protein (cupin superfamily)
MTDGLPRTIENPLAGERMTFLETAEETGGERVRTRNEVSAGAQGPPLHYHLAYTEAFEVLKGRLDLCVGAQENHLVLAEGESAFVPLNTAHRFWNSSPEPTVFEVEIRPARNFEKSIRTQMGLIEDGRTNARGLPRNILELALLYELSESYVVGMPLFLQKGIFGALARVARWRGYDPEFFRYTKPGGAVVGRTPPQSGPGTLALAASAALLALLLLRRRSRRGGKR